MFVDIYYSSSKPFGNDTVRVIKEYLNRGITLLIGVNT